MPVQTELLRDNHLIVHTWKNPITIGDIDAAFNAGKESYDQSTGLIHTIFVHREMSLLPPSAINMLLRHPYSPVNHPKSGLLVIAAIPTFLRTMGQTVARLRPKKVFVVATFDQAIAKLNSVLEAEKSKP